MTILEVTCHPLIEHRGLRQSGGGLGTFTTSTICRLWNRGRMSSSIFSSKRACCSSPFRTSVRSRRCESTLPSTLHSRASVALRPFRSCHCFATSNSLRLHARFAHFSIPAPHISPVRSPSRSLPQRLTPIGRGTNSRARYPTTSPSIVISHSFQNWKGLLQPMAVLRDLPYENQNFRVDLGDGSEGPAASFSQVILPDISIDVIEYRTGNDKESGAHKLPGLAHYGNVILRRGIIGSLNLYNWINQVRNGDAKAKRNVIIALLAEDLATVVLIWKLLRALPVKYSFGDLNAKGTDVAMEELVLA